MTLFDKIIINNYLKMTDKSNPSDATSLLVLGGVALAAIGGVAFWMLNKKRGTSRASWLGWASAEPKQRRRNNKKKVVEQKKEEPKEEPK